MNKKDLKERTTEFAHRCVIIALSLKNTHLGKHIRGQLNRCSTSVPANYRASCLALSKKSFVAKISIVIEEADESNFWLEFAEIEQLTNEIQELKHLINESAELTAIFIASRKTAQKNIDNNK